MGENAIHEWHSNAYLISTDSEKLDTVAIHQYLTRSGKWRMQDTDKLTCILLQASKGRQPCQRDCRMMLQKLSGVKPGVLSFNTSALTLPNVVCGLCFIPS